MELGRPPKQKTAPTGMPRSAHERRGVARRAMERPRTARSGQERPEVPRSHPAWPGKPGSGQQRPGAARSGQECPGAPQESPELCFCGPGGAKEGDKCFWPFFWCYESGPPNLIIKEYKVNIEWTIRSSSFPYIYFSLFGKAKVFRKLILWRMLPQSLS